METDRQEVLTIVRRVEEAALVIVSASTACGETMYDFDVARLNAKCCLSVAEAITLRAVVDKYPGRSICEVGCGWGLLSNILALSGWNTTAYEATHHRFVVAGRIRDMLGTKLGLVEGYYPGDRSFDVVIGTNIVNSWFLSYRPELPLPERVKSFMQGADGVFDVRTWWDRVRAEGEQADVVRAFRDAGYRVEPVEQTVFRFVR